MNTVLSKAVGARTLVRLSRREAVVAALIPIVVLGGWLRLSGSSWDSGQHLHPDDRYVSTVADNIHWPGSPVGYFDVHGSPLSPYNTEAGRHYVYGLLPLFATKLAATAIGRDDYDRLNIVGRRLSALVDTASILLVFLIGLLLLEGFGSRAATMGALVAAALYAVVVAAIQAGHFFTMESWLVFFTLLTFYFSARVARSAPTPSSPRFQPVYIGVGASLGLTVACKVSGALVAVPVVVALLGQTAVQTRRARLPGAWLRFCAAALTVLVAGYVTFRAVSPYVFASSNWFDLSLNHDFRAALAEQQNLTNGKSLYPPLFQWLLSPRVWGPFENLVVWQLGLPLGIAATAGIAVMGAHSLRAPIRMTTRRLGVMGGSWQGRRARSYPEDTGATEDAVHGPPSAARRPALILIGALKPLVAFARHRRSADEPTPAADAAGTVRVMLVTFVLTAFFYFSSRFAHFGRYLLPAVPFLPLAAVYPLVAFVRRAFWPIAAALVLATAAYALAFHHIYTEPNTRVAATDWIVRHVPAGATIDSEHWDDSLPVGGAAAPYKLVQLPVFEPDDGTKLRKLYDGLAPADYYALSSPRAWKTIGRLPDRFPLMVRFYRLLFAGALGFEQVASFRSEPELFGVRLHDLGAEEAWWVYDHPPVKIFRRAGRLSWARFRSRLCLPSPPLAACDQDRR